MCPCVSWAGHWCVVEGVVYFDGAVFVFDLCCVVGFQMVMHWTLV